ncbi:hypothetical protein AcV7_005616 [Taiwanofungus camphoratus]|nr:hypothetical protein AcV7_005616 [Antrodia cinnamomea]
MIDLVVTLTWYVRVGNWILLACPAPAPFCSQLREGPTLGTCRRHPSMSAQSDPPAANGQGSFYAAAAAPRIVPQVLGCPFGTPTQNPSPQTALNA